MPPGLPDALVTLREALGGALAIVTGRPIETVDRLFGDAYRWSVLGAGRNQMPVAAMSAAMGGNVRVGLEDSLWLGVGRLAPSNASQVTQVRKIIEGLGLDVATPDEAREILSLKGGDRVGF